MRLRVLAVLLTFPAIAWSQSNTLRQPNVNASAQFFYRNSNYNQDETATTRNGFDLKEFELQFYADVDPFTRMESAVVVKPKYTAVTNQPPTKSWEVEAEEVFADLTQIPKVRVRLGKFNAFFGKENQEHGHARAFFDRALANQNFFGDDPLNSFGVSAAHLLPTSWYSDIIIQYFNSPLNSPSFAGPAPSDGLGIFRWVNALDLGDQMTFEVGASYARGRNSTRGSTGALGADLTLKWLPEKTGLYQSWTLQLEYIGRDFEQTGTTNEKDSGLNVWARYYFARNWAAAARWDTMKVEGANSTVQSNALTNGDSSKKTAALIYSPSEFSNYRLEYSQATTAAQTTAQGDEKKVLLIANFLIGSHPPHKF